MSLGSFLALHVPWRYARLYYSATRPLRRLIHRMRFKPMPPGGWGKGWRVLVFRYWNDPGRQLHVLAPVDGDAFDWELLRLHVGGQPWPGYTHEAGRQTGVMGWAGHHTCVVTEEYGPQRVSMGKLVPGEFKGGVDVGFVLIDVREATVDPP